MCEKSDRHIDQSRLHTQLAPFPQTFKIEIVQETGSTNADLMARLCALEVLERPIVRIAYQQTAGRGRHGRRWLAKRGEALLFSVASSIPRPIHRLVGLSLAAGTAVLAGLRVLPLTEPHRLALKWPNDILLDDAKLAGILIETARSTPTASIVVMGIGINLEGECALAAQLGAQANSPAALARILDKIEITEVLAHVLNALATMLEIFGVHGFAPFHHAWCADHAYLGRNVILLEQQQERARGVLVGIDACGRLQIDTGAKRLVISNGDLSLRV